MLASCHTVSITQRATRSFTKAIGAAKHDVGPKRKYETFPTTTQGYANGDAAAATSPPTANDDDATEK